MIQRLDPGEMSRRERAEELAGLLAEGYRRLLAKRREKDSEPAEKISTSESIRLVWRKEKSD